MAPTPDDPWSDLAEAERLRDLGLLEEAEARYQGVIERDPRQFNALMGLGHLARRRGEIEAAAEAFARAMDAAPPEDPWAYVECAGALRAQGREEEAAEVYERLLERVPEQSYALLGLAQIRLLQGRAMEALSLFRRASKDQASARASLLELAEGDLEAGRLETAKAIVYELEASYPDLDGLRRVLGLVERALGRRAEALAAFELAHVAAPDDLDVLAELAREAIATGAPDRAAELFDRVLERRPTDVRLLCERGDLWRRAGRPDEALQFYERAIALRPEDASPYLEASRILGKRRDWPAAAERLAAGEARLGPHPEILALRIEHLRTEGRWLEALALARDAFHQHPASFGLWEHWFGLERLVSSEEELRLCLLREPARDGREIARLHARRGQAALRSWRVKEALRHFNLSLKINPEDGETKLDRALARLLWVEPHAAREDLEEALRQGPGEPGSNRGPRRVSETHLGQLINEFLLDKEALLTLKEARSRPLEARADACAALVRAVPDYTPAALFLLIALREKAMLSGPPGERGLPDAVPPEIIQYWPSPDAPPALDELAESWRLHNPALSLIRYDHAGASALLTGLGDGAVLKAFQRARDVVHRSNLFRLAALYLKGGYYVDVLDRCLSPLGPITAKAATLALYQEDFGSVGNNIVIAAPRHPVIGLALKNAALALNRGDQDSHWFLSGPGLLTRATAQLLAEPGPRETGALDHLQVLSRAEISRAAAMNCQVDLQSPPEPIVRLAPALKTAEHG